MSMAASNRGRRDTRDHPVVALFEWAEGADLETRIAQKTTHRGRHLDHKGGDEP